MPVKGIARVKKNIRATLDNAAGPVTERAVYSLLSQGAALAQTMTPIDTSNLINSQYEPQISRSVKGVTGHVGYTAEYAGAVHEAPGTLEGEPRSNGNGAYWDPAGEPQFLTKGFEALEPQIPAILQASYDV